MYANDLSPASHKLMKDNFELNQLDPTKYKQTLENVNMMLINTRNVLIKNTLIWLFVLNVMKKKILIY